MNEDRKRDGNYYNRGRSKIENPVKFDLDPKDEDFWNKLAENYKNGFIEDDCPF